MYDKCDEIMNYTHKKVIIHIKHMYGIYSKNQRIHFKKSVSEYLNFMISRSYDKKIVVISEETSGNVLEKSFNFQSSAIFDIYGKNKMGFKSAIDDTLNDVMKPQPQPQPQSKVLHSDKIEKISRVNICKTSIANTNQSKKDMYSKFLVKCTEMNSYMELYNALKSLPGETAVRKITKSINSIASDIILLKDINTEYKINDRIIEEFNNFTTDISNDISFIDNPYTKIYISVKKDAFINEMNVFFLKKINEFKSLHKKPKVVCKYTDYFKCVSNYRPRSIEDQSTLKLHIDKLKQAIHSNKINDFKAISICESIINLSKSIPRFSVKVKNICKVISDATSFL